MNFQSTKDKEMENMHVENRITLNKPRLFFYILCLQGVYITPSCKSQTGKHISYSFQTISPYSIEYD